MSDMFNILGGQSVRIFKKYERKKPFCGFFKPHENALNFLSRSASVITAPVIFTGLSAYSTFFAASSITKSLGYLMLLNTTSSINECIDFFAYAVTSLVFLALVIASPAINLVDVIGGGINSIFGKSSAGVNDGSQISTPSANDDSHSDAEFNSAAPAAL